MNYKVIKAVGLNTDQQAALATSLGEGDQLFLAVSKLLGDDAFGRGRQLLSDASDFYLSEEGNAGEKLKATFTEVKEKLKEEQFSLLLGCVSGKILYLIGEGEVAAYLVRADQLLPLLEQETQLISGFLQGGDRVLLSTKNLVTLLGDELMEILKLPLETIEEEINSRISIEAEPKNVKSVEEEPPEVENGHGVSCLVLDVIDEDLVSESLEEEQIQIPKSEDVALEKPQILDQLKDLGPLVLSKLSQIRLQGKLRLILAIGLILVICLGVGLKYKAAKDSEKSEKFANYLQLAKDEFSAAEGLRSLNPQEAGIRLSRAKESLQLALNIKANNSEANDFKKKIDEESLSIQQKFDKVSFNEFLNLELIKKGLNSKTFSLSSEKLLILNPDDKTLVSIDIAKKSHQILSGKDDLGDAQKASISDKFAFIYSSDKGLIRVDIGSQKLSVIAKKDSDWGQITDIVGYGGNVYLLDSTNGQIWKYLPTVDGFSDKREYLTKGKKVDFKASIKMQIDSSVYVLAGNAIFKFTKGVADNFAISGLDKPLKDSKSFFVSSETENLYILDSGNARLIVLTKTGQYLAQYAGDKFGTSSDFVVDEKDKKVYLLEGSKIYQMDLK